MRISYHCENFPANIFIIHFIFSRTVRNKENVYMKVYKLKIYDYR